MTRFESLMTKTDLCVQAACRCKMNGKNEMADFWYYTSQRLHDIARMLTIHQAMEDSHG